MQTVLFFLENWRWGVEILLLAAAFYYIWKLIRGTRGARMLAGLAIILVGAMLLAGALQLSVVAELLNGLSGIFVLAVIIIFQPELRALLADVGGHRLRGGSNRNLEVIESVVTAVEVLRREDFGALIAFDNSGSPFEGEETGTVIDARVSADLLASIFHDRTPLHDGGVIIRKDRVALAAVVFPLSQTEGLDRDLGLRHRAALGMSMETDAVVVVLSEETCTISVAVDGRLERGLDADHLRARLHELLDPSETEHQQRRRARREKQEADEAS